jgi:hypothetical protein
MKNNFNLTEYRYFRPKIDSIGFFGTNRMFLLDSPKDYYLSPNTIYQILKEMPKVGNVSASSWEKLYPEQNRYKILDLKTMAYHNLMIHQKHRLKNIEQFMELYE